MITDFFFVYGTLKEGGCFAKDFDKFRVSSEKAKIDNMALYKVGWFPGIIPGNGSVEGELHEYKNVDMVTQIMNRIEGCSGSKSDLFRCERHNVMTVSGKEIEANVYIFNQETKHAKLIENGIWLNKE
jgi:gamma-glutamylcyclotransferase (GGCT)/AIG2-like uncharacterized protein YtfP